MKIVLDTNVLVSGIFFSGPPHHILEAWQKGKIELVLTMEIVEEYRRVVDHLERQFKGISVFRPRDFVDAYLR